MNGVNMAKNHPPGDGSRIGAVQQGSQTITPSGNYAKRDTETGCFLDMKTTDKTALNLQGCQAREEVGGPWSAPR